MAYEDTEYRCNLLFSESGSGQFFQNSIAISVGSSTEAAVANNVADGWATNCLGLQVPSVLFISVLCRNLATGATAEQAVGENGTWSPTADSAPLSLAAYATLHTLQPGRVGRGRIYLGGCPITQLDSPDTTQWSSEFTSSVQAGLEAMLAYLDGIWSVDSRKEATLFGIDHITAHQMVGSQRNRRL